MKLLAFEAVAKALAQEQVRYLVAGGLAVNAHGYVRLTMDIDIVIALDSDNIRSTFRALSELGYQPTIPIDTEDFARPEQREQWREEKGMQVLNLQSDRFPGTSVDIFVYEPFDFAREPLNNSARARRVFARGSASASASVVWWFQMSDPKRSGDRAKARPEGFCRRSRISRVAPLGRSYGYCHSRRTTRSAASPTKRAPCTVVQRFPKYDAALIGELLPELPVRFVSIPTLIEMKQTAGRPRDLDDIQHLRQLQESDNHE